jgi:hypothetical protein
MAEIDRSWESLLWTTEEIVDTLGLLTDEPIKEAIDRGELAALSIGGEGYVVYADFIAWVVRQSERGFRVTDPDGKVWMLSDLRGVPGSPLNKKMEAARASVGQEQSSEATSLEP